MTFWLMSCPVSFLLTPLREGRRKARCSGSSPISISTHAPAGGATVSIASPVLSSTFLLTPLREGRLGLCSAGCTTSCQFLLTPLREGRPASCVRSTPSRKFLLTPLREGRRGSEGTKSELSAFLLTPLREGRRREHGQARHAGISTHAPAGGATAIFHKSVMRFCGKLPKDDTVLCLASFGFPRRDPKAVYLAWISCANLPQKCAREGLALKDQGTSCFHEGLASHAFDPVLV